MSFGLERCFLFDAIEDSYPITEVSGRIPETLRGTHYVNGPARFRRGEVQYKHWLDGDGMICALRFGPDGAHFTNRFIQTKKLLDEDAADLLPPDEHVVWPLEPGIEAAGAPD